jgi:multiple sugar transport system ATP-binding protein
MAELTLDEVTKVFTEDDGNEITAVDEVSVDIEDGEFLVLVGPSGCGKSTTLRMIAGLETITSGEIRLAGQRINEKPPAERDIAMVFQSYALYPHMTVRENMSFGLEESTDMAEAEIDETVEDTAELMEIEELLDRKPSELSGGQQQRVALGRAIVRAPEAFLMDEPLSNLDAKLRATMRTELQRIQNDLDVTTVYVTHDQTEAMTMGDRIAILDDGILQQVGTPLECYHTPNNRFVAGFIGDPSMNFFEMAVDDDTLVIDRFEYPLKPAQQEAVAGRSHVDFGIRPEDIRIKDPGGLSDNYQFEVTVDVVEPRGDENTIHLTFDRSVDDPVTFTATVSGLRDVSAGDEVIATFPPDSIHLFDTDTGVAVHNRTFDSEDATKQVL